MTMSPDTPTLTSVAPQVLLAADVNLHVIAICLDKIHIIDCNEVVAIRPFPDEPRRCAFGERRAARQHRRLVVLLRDTQALRSLKRRQELARGHRFQQIIHGPHAERLERMLLAPGYDDGRRRG